MCTSPKYKQELMSASAYTQNCTICNNCVCMFLVPGHCLSLHDQMICDCEQENQGIYFVSISVPAYIVLPKLRYIDARPIPVYI